MFHFFYFILKSVCFCLLFCYAVCVYDAELFKSQYRLCALFTIHHCCQWKQCMTLGPWELTCVHVCVRARAVKAASMNPLGPSWSFPHRLVPLELRPGEEEEAFILLLSEAHSICIWNRKASGPPQPNRSLCIHYKNAAEQVNNQKPLFQRQNITQTKSRLFCTLWILNSFFCRLEDK